MKNFLKSVRINIRYFLIPLCLSFLSPLLFAQEIPVLDPRDAIYTRVDSFTCLSFADPDTVFVESTAGFAVGDTVLFLETLGSSLKPDQSGEVESIFYTGKYAIMKVGQVSGDTAIVFTSTLPYMINPLSGKVNPVQSGETGQLVKIPVYKQVRVTSDFEDHRDYWDWNPETKTGGVFAFITGKLILDNDLSADGQGFKGAQPEGEFQGVCSSSSGDTIYEKVGNFTVLADSSGRKGESYNFRNYPFVKGFENVAGGGGGGNGKYSGGGGGANIGFGARGGFESAECGANISIGGKGGFGRGFNNDISSFSYNRIFPGSGGGTGTQNPSENRNATPGGNGGGILLVLADTLIGNGFTISANGSSVTEEATAGAGGGGGGGVIIADLGYAENVSFEAKGGDGGNIFDDAGRYGPGGGGGGGLIAWNDAILLTAGKNVSRGRNGTYRGSSYNGFEIAGNGQSVSDVNIPIKGFIINPLGEDQTICQHEVPALFQSAKPKGGNGNYSYQWLMAENIHPDSFRIIPDANEMTYQYPDPLEKTTYFKRKVSSGPTVDETFFLTVEVIPEISNNILDPAGTICQQQSPGSLGGTTAGELSGGLGEGSYSFVWQSRSMEDEWQNIPGAGDAEYLPANLFDTTLFRRVVNSGVCSSFSDSIYVNVLPVIEGNQISTDQTVYCHNQEILPLNGGELSGGNEEYSYRWERKTGDGDWIEDAFSANFPGVNLASADGAPETYLFRRTVFSGESNVCSDTSAELSITVLPEIVNNEIAPDQDTLCANIPDFSISGSLPSGGDDVSYNYIWEQSIDGLTWANASGEFTLRDYMPPPVSSTTYFRRLVRDGSSGVCSSSSEARKITILPVISLNSIGDNMEQCQGEESEILNGSVPEGGDGRYSYLWQSKTGEEGDWLNTGIFSENYQPGTMSEADDFYYRRIVKSGENNTCVDTSAELRIHVEGMINGNSTDDTLIKACYETDVIVNLPGATGGDGEITSYLWQDSISGGTWENIAESVNEEDLLIESLSRNTALRRIAWSQSGLCNSVSPVIFADTLTPPVLTSFGISEDTICDDLPFSLYFSWESMNYAPFTLGYTDGEDSSEADLIRDSLFFSGYDKTFQDLSFQVLSVTDINGCEAKGDFSKTLSLWVNDAPSPQIADNNGLLEICGSTFELSAHPDTHPGVSAGWWETAVPGILRINNADKVNAEFSLSSPFNQHHDTIYFKQSTAKCGSRADTLLVSLYEPPRAPLIYKGDKHTLFIIDNDTIGATPPSAGSFEWSINEGGASISDPFQNPVQLTNIPIDEISLLSYTVANGVCQAVSATIEIDRKEVHIYEGISPGEEDGQNDFLVAEGLDVENLAFNFQIFSTNGLLIREISDQDIDDLGYQKGLPDNGLEVWDGTNIHNENYVPPGTYYYVLIIEYRNLEFVKKGFVVVR